MTTIIHFCLAFLLALQVFTPLNGKKPAPKENTYVKFKATVAGKSVKAGKEETLKFMLTPQKGIHINLNPAMSFAFDALDTMMFKQGKLDIPRNQKTGYLDSGKPVTLKVLCTNNVKPGTITLQGTLTYYFCSDAEGWCNKYKQPVTFTLKISK